MRRLAARTIVDYLVDENLFLHCLAPQVGLAGLSRREAQGTAKTVGVRFPNPASGHPPVLPVDFAPSINWPGLNAHPRSSLGILPFFVVAHRIRNSLNSTAFDGVGTILTLK